MYLLDTNVISELVRTRPDPTVRSFVRALSPASVFTATICEAEIRYGLARMPAGTRRETLIADIAQLFDSVFEHQILPFDSAGALFYGQIRVTRETKGRPIEVEDAMIAAIASAHGATLLTRNIKDFDDCGIVVLNPWTRSQD